MINPQDMCYSKESSGPGMRPVLSLGITSDKRVIGEGSLPNSPESDCEELSVVRFTEGRTLENDTREIINDSLLELTGRSNYYSRHRKVVGTMKRVVNSLVEKHELAYKGMIVKLNLEERGEDMRVITTVAKEMFSDGKTNWGRIASLLAFGSMVCKYHNEKGQGHRVRLVGEEISSYLLSDKRDWLLKNKAWDGFVDFFHVSDPESKLRNALMTIATVAGIGAGIAFFRR